MSGERKRGIVVGMFEEAMKHSGIEVLPQTIQSLLRGLDLYKARSDKSYSLTDCISMVTMRERSITDVLTHDRHFAQEGFNVLL
jgi:predicted nucleic acid-binding protein